MTKTEELLAVLDMSEELDPVGWNEQMYWISRNVIDDPDEAQAFYKGYISLADLAFRLRDEASVVGKMHKGIKAVCKKVCAPNMVWVEWWTYEAKPIHWIIAALIAKELRDDKNR